MKPQVLDVSAVLAWLWQEEGSDRISNLLAEQRCLLGSVNPAEIISKTLDKGMPPDKIAELLLASLDAEFVPFSLDQTVETGLLRPLTRGLCLSLGDRACLALAKARGAVAVTADRIWLNLDEGLGVEIECIRQNRN